MYDMTAFEIGFTGNTNIEIGGNLFKKPTVKEDPSEEDEKDQFKVRTHPQILGGFSP